MDYISQYSHIWEEIRKIDDIMKVNMMKNNTALNKKIENNSAQTRYNN